MENSYSVKLIQKFRQIFSNNNTPEWAFEFKPSIPFIGENYEAEEGLLIYASAENLTWYYKQEPDERFKGDEAWNRYWIEYEKKGQDSKNFFSKIGIQPMNNGGLYVAGLYVSMKYGSQQVTMPSCFLKNIAVSNWCKFSIKAKTNIDQARSRKKLEASLPYVVEELKLLRPKVTLVPKTIYRHGEIAKSMKNVLLNSIFFPVYQFNGRVVNCCSTLKGYDSVVDGLMDRWKDSTLSSWMDKLKSINRHNAWRYIADLEKTYQDLESK